MVSKASEDLPEPDRPVNTTRRSRGISRSISLRLCSRAPRMAMTRGSRASLVGSLAGRFLSKRSFIGKWLPFPQRLAAGYRARIRPERSENAELLPGRGGRLFPQYIADHMAQITWHRSHGTDRMAQMTR